MKPLIETRQTTFQLNGSLPTVQKTCVGRYMTPRQERIAPSAKRAIIFAGLKYFMRKVAIQRAAMKSEMAIV